MISQKLYLASFLEYLAINTGSSISISSTYILFLTKMQKRQTLQKGSAFNGNDITTFEPTLKLGIHSRYQRFRIDDFILT
jgi:hypothetical protein